MSRGHTTSTTARDLSGERNFTANSAACNQLNVHLLGIPRIERPIRFCPTQPRKERSSAQTFLQDFSMMFLSAVTLELILT